MRVLPLGSLYCLPFSAVLCCVMQYVLHLFILHSSRCHTRTHSPCCTHTHTHTAPAHTKHTPPAPTHTCTTHTHTHGTHRPLGCVGLGCDLAPCYSVNKTVYIVFSVFIFKSICVAVSLLPLIITICLFVIYCAIQH